MSKRNHIKESSFLQIGWTGFTVKSTFSLLTLCLSFSEIYEYREKENLICTANMLYLSLGMHLLPCNPFTGLLFLWYSFNRSVIPLIDAWVVTLFFFTKVQNLPPASFKNPWLKSYLYWGWYDKSEIWTDSRPCVTITLIIIQTVIGGRKTNSNKKIALH